MSKRMMLFVCVLFFTDGTFAEETKISGFNQVIDVNPDQNYQSELKDLNPSTQLWTAFYVVGVPQSAGAHTQANLTVTGEGLIAKNHPKIPVENITLIANDLPVRQNYSLNEFKDLVSEIEEQTGQKIQEPNVSQTNNVRVYGQILDWIPEYNLQKPAKISFSIHNSRDFDIKAIYMIVGEGVKTPQLLKLAIGNNAGEIQETSIKTQANASHSSFSNSLVIKVFVFLASAALMGIIAFLKRKRA